MEHNKYKEKLFEKALVVMKRNIDNENIKTEVFSLRLNDDDESGYTGKYDFGNSYSNPKYLKVSINRKEYGEKLDEIMNYFIKNEWYEDCAIIKEYQQKLKRLQKNDEKGTSRTKSRAVKTEL